jgi:hypothetical protein
LEAEDLRAEIDLAGEDLQAEIDLAAEDLQVDSVVQDLQAEISLHLNLRKNVISIAKSIN